MNDPYSVLGVSSSASDDEIKKVYRELARKYHPDTYANNPLADLASEKMKEINEAYDQIMKMRSNNSGPRRSGGSSGPYSSAGGGSAAFAEVRQAINAGNYERAEQLLYVSSDKGAEWNFLMGSIAYRKGWMDEASRYFQIAVSMEPANMEYRQALNYMRSSGGMYRRGTTSLYDDNCDTCSSLLCASCVCDCMRSGIRCF